MPAKVAGMARAGLDAGVAAAPAGVGDAGAAGAGVGRGASARVPPSMSCTASSARRNSSALWKRSSGRLDRARRMALQKLGGSPLTSCWGGWGGWSRCARSTPVMPPPLKGSLPVASR